MEAAHLQETKTKSMLRLLVTASDFVVTASRDGQLKFWKKMQAGIEFVKHFRAHLAPISGCAATLDGSLLATTTADRAFKVFDVLSFDMINWVRLASPASATPPCAPSSPLAWSGRSRPP